MKLLFLALSIVLVFADPTVYNRTITLQLNEIFTYALPNNAALYYDIHAADNSLFSVIAISEDQNKQPYYYSTLAVPNTSTALLTKKYNLPTNLNNLHLMVTNENQVGEIKSLSVFIEYDQGSLSEWVGDHWGSIVFWIVIAVVGTIILLAAIVLVIRRSRQAAVAQALNEAERVPLISDETKNL